MKNPKVKFRLSKAFDKKMLYLFLGMDDSVRHDFYKYVLKFHPSLKKDKKLYNNLAVI